MSITLSILGVLLFIVAFYFIKTSKVPVVADSEKVKLLNDQNFKHQIKDGITLVDFWASWCMPCKMMVPILNDVSEELPANASVGKLNVEESQAIASQYNVRSIPTLILFKNGVEINRFVGVKPKDFLVSKIINA